MKLKFLRIIALCISVVMICTVLSACMGGCKDTQGSENNSSDVTSSDNQSDVSSEDTSSEDASSDDNAYTDDASVPASTDKETLSSILSGSADNSSSSAQNSSNTSSGNKEEENSNVVKDYKGKERTVSVNLSKVVNKSFFGVGGNIVPYAYMPSNMAEGYNEAYHNFDIQRYKTMGLDMVRLWVQVDWFEKQKGVYNFDTPEMFSVCKVVEGLQKIGCNVQLTFSWKVDGEAQEWYSIPGLEDPRISAPRDIEHFGEECVVLLKYLRETKGFKNVKHITFGNEPNGDWDWNCHGNQPEYYVSVVKAVDKAMKKAGIRDDVNIWACEASSRSYPAWLPVLAENCSDSIDVWSVHESLQTNTELLGILKQIQGYALKPLFISEYQEGHQPDYFVGGNAGHVINGTQNGLAGFTTWDFLGVRHMSTTDSAAWEMEDANFPDGRLGFVFHNHFSSNIVAGSVGFHYYTLSMMTKWVDGKNKVYKTDTTLSNDDVRSTTIENADGSITVIVECDKSDVDREVTVDFGKNINKTFTRHVFRLSDYPENWKFGEGPIDVDSKINTNAIIPLSEGTFKCTSKFTDKDIPNEYSIIVYTTKPTEAQIAFKAYDDTHATSIGALVARGQSTKVEAYILDGKASDEIVFSVMPALDGTLHGTIDSKTGVFTANTNAPLNEAVAIRASLKSDPDNYKIFLVKIANQ